MLGLFICSWSSLNVLYCEITCNANSTSTFPPWHAYHFRTELFKWFECFVLAQDPERLLQTTVVQKLLEQPKTLSYPMFHICFWKTEFGNPIGKHTLPLVTPTPYTKLTFQPWTLHCINFWTDHASLKSFNSWMWKAIYSDCCLFNGPLLKSFPHLNLSLTQTNKTCYCLIWQSDNRCLTVSPFIQ